MPFKNSKWWVVGLCLLAIVAISNQIRIQGRPAVDGKGSVEDWLPADWEEQTAIDVDTTSLRDGSKIQRATDEQLISDLIGEGVDENATDATTH